MWRSKKLFYGHFKASPLPGDSKLFEMFSESYIFRTIRPQSLAISVVKFFFLEYSRGPYHAKDVCGNAWAKTHEMVVLSSFVPCSMFMEKSQRVTVFPNISCHYIFQTTEGCNDGKPPEDQHTNLSILLMSCRSGSIRLYERARGKANMGYPSNIMWRYKSIEQKSVTFTGIFSKSYK